jgi:hypothetical protein
VVDMRASQRPRVAGVQPQIFGRRMLDVGVWGRACRREGRRRVLALEGNHTVGERVLERAPTERPGGKEHGNREVWDTVSSVGGEGNPGGHGEKRWMLPMR